MNPPQPEHKLFADLPVQLSQKLGCLKTIKLKIRPVCFGASRKSMTQMVDNISCDFSSLCTAEFATLRDRYKKITPDLSWPL